ncbi:coiled-coil domain-containing protein 25-like isoform X2 [Gordionus sp. m RMFG-2023]|uniref:coiled-coil domain-containing protein 25-like isoform X2 n=1 Tax=Gordionus sp. m RMFG-2023 TaxID=3053472 RepID=UPI0031FBCF1A
MVFYFESIEPPALLYMGKDKFENEELIRWGWPEDIWFHVDDHSSAHVYLRLKENQTMDDISEKLLQDCCQLVKANSIKGNKINNLDIIYTPWSNLLKTGDMVAGQVGFKDKSLVRKCKISSRENFIINRLNKTKRIQESIDFAQSRSDRDALERRKNKEISSEIKEKEKMAERQKVALEQERSYVNLMNPEKMVSNTNSSNLEDDFM